MFKRIKAVMACFLAVALCVSVLSVVAFAAGVEFGPFLPPQQAPMPDVEDVIDVTIPWTGQTPPELEIYDIFKDLSPYDAWCDDFAIMYVRGLMTGKSGSSMDPYGIVTRAELVTVLWRLAGSPEEGSNAFYDIDEISWYNAPVSWAVENGIVSGYGNGRFGPNDVVTLEQMATILYRYCERYGLDTQYLAGESFEELGYDRASGWAKEALRWFYSNCVDEDADTSLGRYWPECRVCRGQLAETMVTFMAKYDL